MTTETKQPNERWRSRYRHGLYSARMPRFKGSKYVERQANIFRRNVEDAVAERDGDVSEYNATVIAAVTEWIKHGLWSATESSNHYAKLTPEQRPAYRREIPRAFGEAVKLLKSIDLHKNANLNPLAVLYGSPGHTN